MFPTEQAAQAGAARNSEPLNVSRISEQRVRLAVHPPRAKSREATVRISSRDEYRAAVQRAAAVSDALPDSEEGREFQRLTSAIRRWDEAHKSENASGPEPDQSLLRPDNLPFSGLPGNLGKLRKD